MIRSFKSASLHYVDADADGVADLRGEVALSDSTVDADDMLEGEQAVG